MDEELEEAKAKAANEINIILHDSFDKFKMNSLVIQGEINQQRKRYVSDETQILIFR